MPSPEIQSYVPYRCSSCNGRTYTVFVGEGRHNARVRVRHLTECDALASYRAMFPSHYANLLPEVRVPVGADLH